MRTTVSIDDHLLAAAKLRAQERGQTLGRVLEDALRRELGSESRDDPPAIPVSRRRGGPRLGLDWTSNRAVQEFLDAGLPLDKLR